MRGSQRARRLLSGVAIVVALAAITASSAKDAPPANTFVSRTGPRLVLAGHPFRFGGANIEWLGLAGYGPAEPEGPHYASHYEIDDALATAEQMGADVVRSQTIGDSVGCSNCLEPALGQFNQASFDETDYALAAARAHGIRIIATLIGDDAAGGGSGCVYLRWRNIEVPNCSLINMAPFWSDPTVIADVEEHIKALLEHINAYTHLAYKDDPTILGWDLMNGGGSPHAWTREIVDYIRGLDPHHLILSGPGNADIAGVDACVAFVYPHWQLPPASIKPGLAVCHAAAKPFLAYEYGWDATNYPTQQALRTFLATLRDNPTIAGDAFWALQAHNDGHGWMPIPADSSDPTTARNGESGQWWALYYTGIQTMANTAADMAARAQIIRSHNYAMRGLRPPPHAVPRAPTITSIDYGPTSFVGRLGARVYWQGTAGAARYTVQRAPDSTGPWQTICRRCATDTDNGFVDSAPAAKTAWYRVIANNPDNRPGPPSRPVEASPA